MASAGAAGPPQARIGVSYAPGLDAGFHLLDELKAAEARSQFAAWQEAHPGDPPGSASEAASYLFEECYRQDSLRMIRNAGSYARRPTIAVSPIAVGFIGALFGPWVARQLHLFEPLTLHLSGHAFPIIWSIIGAALFVALLHLLSGRRWVDLIPWRSVHPDPMRYSARVRRCRFTPRWA